MEWARFHFCCEVFRAYKSVIAVLEMSEFSVLSVEESRRGRKVVVVLWLDGAAHYEVFLHWAEHMLPFEG